MFLCWAVFTDEGACVERWKSTHGAAQREAIRGAAVFQAGPNGSRVNAATRDCQQLLSPHLLNKWRDLSKKARRALTDDHSGGERCVYMYACDRASSGVCAHTLSCRRERRERSLVEDPWQLCLFRLPAFSSGISRFVPLLLQRLRWTSTRTTWTAFLVFLKQKQKDASGQFLITPKAQTGLRLIRRSCLEEQKRLAWSALCMCKLHT